MRSDVQKEHIRLTPQQQTFVDEYLISNNASQAAIKAGYSQKSAPSSACRLLKMDKVKRYLQQQQTKIAGDKEDLAKRVINELARVAFANISEYVGVEEYDKMELRPHPLIPGKTILTKVGTYQVITINDLDDLPDDKKAAISKIVQRSDGRMEVQLHSKTTALEMLCKHLGLFTAEKQGTDVEDLTPLVEMLKNGKK